MNLAGTGDVNALASMIAKAENAVGFTGAGISTECGVPDFRSPGSPWKEKKPIAYADYLASPDARREAWRRKFRMDDLYRDARPGRGHAALAKLVQAGRMSAIITQNIDNLHQVSGVTESAIIELHGNDTFARCIDCGKRHELAWVREGFADGERLPHCEECGGIVKSATVSFGQAMPRAEVVRAQQAALSTDLLLCIGSSLVVYPAALFPQMAVENGARLAIVNREPTKLDHLADLVIRADIGTILDAVADLVPLHA